MPHLAPIEAADLSASIPSRFTNLQDFEPCVSLVRPTMLKPRGNPNKVETQAQAQKRKDWEEAASWAGEVARLEARNDRILAERKKRDLSRLQTQLAAATSPTTKPKRVIMDKLSCSHRPRPNATDAPAHANHCGERTVTVQYLSSAIKMLVTNETKPIDIVHSATNLSTRDVVPADCVIIECYAVLGLERCLRHCERIRDVMDSWDCDQQNTLQLRALDTNKQKFELSNVPHTDEPPTGFTLLLYHSSRPGKWTKRYITLMDSGQMSAAKRPDSNFTEKDSAVLCHLSEFDIYTPENHSRRHLKPPKKFCYAVKSQQKTTLCPDGKDFVHFFSTDDDQLAYRFYELVHGWRSWHLAKKKDDAIPKKDPCPRVRRTGLDVIKPVSISGSSTRYQPPQVETSRYSIGDVKPLIDMKQFDKPIEELGKNLNTDKKLSEHRTSPGLSPKAFGKVRTVLPTLPIPAHGGNVILAGGSLGLKAAESIAEVREAQAPLVEGFSLKSPPISTTEHLEPPSWFPSATEHSNRSRSHWQPQEPPPKTANTARTKLHASANRHPPMTLRSDQSQGGRRSKALAGAPLLGLAGDSVNRHRDQMPLFMNTSKAGSASGMEYNGRRPGSRPRATVQSWGQRHAVGSPPPVPPLPIRSARRLARVQPELLHNGNRDIRI